MLRASVYLVIPVLVASCAYQDPIHIPDESLAKSRPIAPPQSLDLTPRIALSKVGDRVVRNHPNLRAARLRIREAEGKLVQAGLPLNPSIGLGTGKTGLGGQWDLTASFSQQLPITNRLGLEKRVSFFELELAKAELQDVERRLIEAAQDQALEILALRAKEAQINTQITLLQTMVDFISTAAERGELSSLDAAQAKVELTKLQSAADALAIQQRGELIRLKAAFGMNPSAELELLGELSPPRSLNRRIDLNKRPDYRFKEIEEKAALSRISLEKAKQFGDVTTNIEGGVMREEDAPDGLETEARIGVGMSIPLPLYNRNQGNIAAAQASAERVSLEKQALAVTIREQVASAQIEAEGWMTQYQTLTNSLIPQASENSEELEKALRNGQAGFLSLLQARQQELDLKAQRVEALENYHHARNDYFSAIGSPQSAY